MRHFSPQTLSWLSVSIRSFHSEACGVLELLAPSYPLVSSPALVLRLCSAAVALCSSSDMRVHLPQGSCCSSYLYACSC